MGIAVMLWFIGLGFYGLLWLFFRHFMDGGEMSTPWFKLCMSVWTVVCGVIAYSIGHYAAYR